MVRESDNLNHEKNRLCFELLGVSNAVLECAEKLAKASADIDLKRVRVDMERAKSQIFGVQAEVDDKLNGDSK